MEKHIGEVLVFWICGFLFTSVLGLGVGRFLIWIRRQIGLPNLPGRLAIVVAWEKLTKHPKKSGDWVGFFERIVLFWALCASSWEAVGIWMVFKVAAKWEARNHLSHVPAEIEHVSEVDWSAARRVWAAREYATFVVGTAANLLLAAAGVWIGRFGPEAMQVVRPDQVWSQRSLDGRCQRLLNLEHEKDDVDDQRSIISSQFEAFYSAQLETCVSTQVSVIKPAFYIRDLTKNFLKDFPHILQCDGDIHFEVNLESVRTHGGRVGNVAYADWSTTDDRSGLGKAKLLREECQLRFDAMLNRIKR